MQMIPHLHFNGNCEEAFEFYARCLGGKITAMMRYADAPPGMPICPETKNKIMHARLLADGATVMGADAPPERYRQPQGFSVTASVATPALAERIFAELSDKGSVQMAMAETFFAHRFGMTADRFGIPWMVICEKTG